MQTNVNGKATAMPSTEACLPEVVYAVDVESNGGSPPEIIELSIVTIAAGVLKLPPATWMIKPVQKIRGFATKIHGITDADVSQSPPWRLVQDEILSLLGTHSVVAHNAPIDYKLLKLSLPTWHPSAVYDTLRLARFVAPQLSSHNLATLVAHFGIAEDVHRHSLSRAHRANYDAIAAAYLFLSLIDKSRQVGFTLDRILRTCNVHLDQSDPAQGSFL